MTPASKLKIEPCRPPSWARSGHAQTILAHLLPSPTLVPRSELLGERIEIALPGGDRLVARHIAGAGDHVLYVFHGLGGNISADYMVRTAALGRKLGWDVYLVNHRGCGEGRGLAKKPYHSGCGEDLSEVIRFGRARHPGKKHLAVGFSLSANALLILLSGKRGEILPDAAIAVNGPIDLANSSELLGKGLNKIYDFRFSAECRLDVRYRHRQGLLEKKYDFPWMTTLREFDAIYTSAEGGFASREDYYATCSTKDLLSSIQVPTVLLTAKDDPFIDYRDYLAAELPSSVHLHLEEVGGHMGYLNAAKTPLGSNRWLDYALWEYLRALSN
jgi:predicted alpha/beta-fold hydrolase